MAKHTKKQKVADTVKGAAVVTVLVDESGSMQSVWDATINGFNEYVTKLQTDLKGMEVYFSAIKFDGRGVRKLQVGAPLKNAVVLSKANYEPCDTTPLLDAVGKTIEATEQVVSLHKADRIIVMIQTDGFENASREFTRERLKALIDAKTAQGWVFIYVGAGIDAYAEASRIGVATVNTVSHTHDPATMRQMFATVANNSSGYAMTGQAQMASFTAAQKASLGDQFDPAVQVNVNIHKAKKPDTSSAIGDLKLTGTE